MASSKCERVQADSRFDPTKPEAWTDVSNGRLFADQFQGTVAYVHERGKFYVFDGKRWCQNDIQAQELAKQTASGIWDTLNRHLRKVDNDTQDGMLKWARHSSSRSGIANMLAMAKSDDRILVRMDRFNAQPNLINVRNGTLDIESGKLRPHSASDYITQITNAVEYDPSASCPRWLETLNLIFEDIDLISYVQSIIGLALAGTREEAILPICIGDGCNGKSTIWNTILSIFDEYGTLASQDLLVPAKHIQHPADKAALFGRRFVAISEVDQDRYFAEARIKELTGDSFVTCRGMREDFWTYKATHQFWMSANHLPKVRGTDEGIWRRLRPIPYRFNILERAREAGLPERKNFCEWLVRNEGPGILNWILDGYRAYRKDGLVEPAIVSQCVHEYRSNEDEIGSFLKQYCVVEDGCVVPANQLYEAYRTSGGEKTVKDFGKEMKKRFTDKRTNKGVVYQGVGLKSVGSVG